MKKLIEELEERIENIKDYIKDQKDGIKYYQRQAESAKNDIIEHEKDLDILIRGIQLLEQGILPEKLYNCYEKNEKDEYEKIFETNSMDECQDWISKLPNRRCWD